MDSPAKSIRDRLKAEIQALADNKPHADQFKTMISDDYTPEQRKKANEAFINGGKAGQITYLKSIGKYYGE